MYERPLNINKIFWLYPLAFYVFCKRYCITAGILYQSGSIKFKDQIITGITMGFLCVSQKRNSDISYFSRVFICISSISSHEPRYSSIILTESCFTCYISSSDSFTYTKPLDTISGPEIISLPVISSATTTIRSPSCAR